MFISVPSCWERISDPSSNIEPRGLVGNHPTSPVFLSSSVWVYFILQENSVASFPWLANQPVCVRTILVHFKIFGYEKMFPSIHILHGHPQALHTGSPVTVSVLCGPNSVQRFQTQKSSLHAQQVLKQT